MSCEILIYNVAVRRKFKKNKTLDFFDDHENIVPFRKNKKEELKQKLVNSGYKEICERNGIVSYEHSNDHSEMVTLTNKFLQFKSIGNSDIIYKLSEEIIGDKLLARYDPQSGNWD